MLRRDQSAALLESLRFCASGNIYFLTNNTATLSLRLKWLDIQSGASSLISSLFCSFWVSFALQRRTTQASDTVVPRFVTNVQMIRCDLRLESSVVAQNVTLLSKKYILEPKRSSWNHSQHFVTQSSGLLTQASHNSIVWHARMITQ